MAAPEDKTPLLKEDLVDPAGFLPEGSEALAKYIEEDLEIESSTEAMDHLSKEERATLYFLKAAEKGKLDLVSKMLSGDESLLKVTDSDGYTALHRATYNGHVEIVRFLLQQGADVAAKTENGWQPLHCACRWDKTDVASILLQNGADINCQTNGGQTPLHLGTTHSQETSLMELLLTNKYLDASLLNCQNQSAADIAIRNGKHLLIFEMVEPSVNIQW